MTEFYSLNLTYENHTFQVLVDEATYNEVTKDFTTLHQYAKQVFENSIKNNSENTANTEDSASSSGVSSAVPRDSREFKWTENMIKCLLEVRLRKEPEFSKPTCKKIKLWRQVAEEINNICNCQITAEMCDNKYRNLLATYRSNKKKQSSTGEGAIKWEYFTTFDVVLGSKASSEVPTENIGESLEPITCEEASVSEPDAETPSTSKISNMRFSGKIRPHRRGNLSFQAYLCEKLKKDEEKEKMRAERAQKQWEEKKLLKEKEIDAILSLAKAISESAKK